MNPKVGTASEGSNPLTVLQVHSVRGPKAPGISPKASHLVATSLTWSEGDEDGSRTQRLQEGLKQTAKLEDRDIDGIRQDAIRGYLVRRGISLLQDLASTSPETVLSDSEAVEIANQEIRALRRVRGA